MSRAQRHFVAGIPAHIIQRGNDRRPCFTAPSDCLMYLNCLRNAICRHGGPGLDREERCQAYRALFDEVLDDVEVERIRAAIRSNTALGDARFLATVTSRNGCGTTENWGQTRRV